MGSGTVVINHAVTLDMDYSHTSGSVTINSSGSLTGNSAMRAFALNYPSGTAWLTVSGSFHVARVLFNSGGVVINNGICQMDSLLNIASLDNFAAINASQFMNSTGGVIANNGSIASVNFLNLANVGNPGTLTSNDFTNAKSFTNSGTGVVYIAHDFSNIDTMASPAIFANDGVVFVTHDWHNGNQINGAGKFCIGNNSWNSGSMTGTFDFCDQTGGAVDLNTGTIATTITYCVNPCVVGIEELFGGELIEIYPNPFSAEVTFRTEGSFNDAVLTVYNSFGQEVKQITDISGNTVTMHRGNLSGGLYFIRMTNGGNISATGTLVIAD